MASLTVTFIILGIFLPWINARHEYQMQNYCGKHLSMVHESAYQIDLELTDNFIYNNNPWLNTKQQRSCEVTVGAWNSIYPKLMFYFDDIDLDCKNGHLEFYVGGGKTETRVVGLEKNICGEKVPRGSFTVDYPYLRIRYVPTRVQYIKDVFSLTITAFTDGSCPMNSHICANSLCISKDIDCDDISSDTCGEDSNECDDDDSGVTGTIIGATIGGLCLLGSLICLIACCLCCKRTTRKSTVENQYRPNPVVVTSTVPHQAFSQPMYGASQRGSYQTMQVSDPVTSTGVLPTAPVSTEQQYSYIGPADLFSYEEIPMSPPAYSEIYPQPGEPAPPLTEKQEYVHAKPESAKA